jgi:integrase
MFKSVKNENNVKRVKKFRDAKRLAMGDDEYKKQEAEARRLRRNNTKPIIVDHEKVSLIDTIYTDKVEYLEKLGNGKTIKKETVVQQLDKVLNLYKLINNKNNIDNFSFDYLKDTNKVIDFINNNWNTENSRNSQIQAISSILQVNNKYKNEYEFYSKYSTNKRVAINTEASNNLLTDKEKVSIVKWNNIKSIYKKIDNTRDKALVGLYTLLPPRRAQDISNLTLGPSDDANTNSIIIKGKKIIKIIYRKHKTSKTVGVVEVKVPAPLSKLLYNHIIENKIKDGELLFGTNNKVIKNFSEVVSTIFKKYTDKKLTANLLRHSFITYFLKKNPSIAKKQEIATQMGNSVSIQAFYNRIDL